MTLTLEELAQKFEKGLSDGTLVLGPDSVASETILKVIQLATGASQMRILGVDPPVMSHDALSFHGKVRWWNEPAADLDGVVAIVSGEPVLTLKIRPSWKRWTFAKSFPQFAKMTSVPGIGPRPGNFISDVEFLDPVFVIASAPHKDPEFDVDLSLGLNLVAQGSASEPLSAVSRLVSDMELKVSGTISARVGSGNADDEWVPGDIDLSASVTGIRLGGLTFEKASVNFALLSYTEGAAGERQLLSTATFEAKTKIGKTSVDVIAILPSSDSEAFQFSATFGEAIPTVADLIKFAGESVSEAIPETLNDASCIGLTRLGFALSGSSLSFVNFTIESTKEWPVFPKDLVVKGIVIQCMILNPLAGASVRATVSGSLEIEGVTFQVAAEWPGKRISAWTVSGAADLSAVANKFLGELPFTLPQVVLDRAYLAYSSDGGLSIAVETSINLLEFAKALAIPLPDGFDDSLELKGIEIEIGANGHASLAVHAAADISFPHGSENHVSVTDLSFKISREQDKPVAVAAQFTLSGKVSLSDDFTLAMPSGDNSDLVGLTCLFDSEKREWVTQGKVQVTLFGTKLPSLLAEISVENGQARFALCCQDSVQLINEPGVATVSVGPLSVVVAKDANGYDWKLEGESDFNVVSLITGKGKASVEKSATGWEVKVGAGPLSIPAQQWGPITAGVSFQELALTAGSKGNGGVTIETKGMSLEGLPKKPPIDKCLPSSLDGSIHIDKLGAKISCVLPPDFKIDFPELKIPLPDGGTKSLGQPTVGLAAITLNLGKEIDILVTLNVGVPNELNVLFGTHGDDKNFLLKDELKLELGIGTNGAVFRFAASPFTALDFKPHPKHPDQQWFDWSFGELGTFKFRVPEFKLDETSFVAAGGVERPDPLRFPLGWLKKILANPHVKHQLAGLISEPKVDELIKAMPGSIPIEKFDLAKILAALKTALSRDKNLEPLVAAIDKLQALEARLPQVLHDYLTKFELPKSLILDISVDADGGFAFAFEADPEIKLVFPSGIGLTGVTLRGLSIGVALGGAVVKLKIDGWVDSYDFATLAVALLSGEGKDYTGRLRLEKTLWLVPTALPVPIPLFYDPIGWEYKGILGEAHVLGAFPEPSMQDLIKMVATLYQFATTDKELEKDFIPDECDPNIKVGRLALPNFLGGSELNSEILIASLSGGIAPLLNAFKFLNPRYLIEAIPLKADGGSWIRVGHKVIDFGPLRLEAGWCITTEKEFREKVLSDPDACKMVRATNQDNARGFLDTLPKTPGAPALDRGFIILLLGDTKLADIVQFDAQFGSILTGTGGFETHVRLQGEIGGSSGFTSLIEGRLLVKPDRGGALSVAMDGELKLNVLKQTLISAEGDIQVIQGERFETQADVKILGDAFKLGGTWIMDRKHIHIDGKTSLANLIDTRITFDLAFNPPDPAASGKYQLSILGTNIIGGGITVSGASIRLNSAHFRLLPEGSVFNIEGSLSGSIGKNGFSMSDTLTTTIPVLGSRRSNVTVDNNGIRTTFDVPWVLPRFLPQGSDHYTLSVTQSHGGICLAGTYDGFFGKHGIYFDDQAPFMHIGSPPRPVPQGVQVLAVVREIAPSARLLQEIMVICLREMYRESDAKREKTVLLYVGPVLDLYDVTLEMRADETDSDKLILETRILRMTSKEDFFTELQREVVRNIVESSDNHALTNGYDEAPLVDIANAEAIFHVNSRDGLGNATLTLKFRYGGEVKSVVVRGVDINRSSAAYKIIAEQLLANA